MPIVKESRIGALAPEHSFMINPYPDWRGADCPVCRFPNSACEVPLLFQVAPAHFVVLNYACQYCPRCDLLLAHKHEIEHFLRELFTRFEPETIGNDYRVVGLVEKQAWREGLNEPKSVEEILARTHDFKRCWKEFRMTQGGWFPGEQRPRARKPPPSREWVRKRGLGAT
jgi:hypothetical protein